MGTTIRREPVTTSIPAAPDYRFLNITNFGGIEKSSNPFVVESNTASDCLNVYVDEDNALSTRPRLNAVQNLIIAAMDYDYNISMTAKPIGVYDLHDGYLLHLIDDDHVRLCRLEVLNDVVVSGERITGVIDDNMTTPFKVFEQNDKIYVLSGNGYMVIDNGEMSYVEGYVPTTRIAKNKRVIKTLDDGTKSTEYDIEGSSYEDYNLLSDKYKESYFWDGTWGVDSIKQSKSDIVENNYIVSEEATIKNSDDSEFAGTIYQLLPELATHKDDIVLYFLARQNNNVVILGVDSDYKIVDASVKIAFELYPKDFTEDFKDRLVCSNNGLTVALLDDSKEYISYVRRENANSEFVDFTDIVTTGSQFLPNKFNQNKLITISPNGNILAWRHNATTIKTNYTLESNTILNQTATFENTSDFVVSKSSVFGDFFISPRIRDDGSIYVVNIISKPVDQLDWEPKITQIVHPWNTEEFCYDYSLTVSPSGRSFSISATISDANKGFIRSGVWTYPAKYDDNDVFTGMSLSPKKVAESYIDNRWSDMTFSYGASETIVYFKNETTSGRFNALNGEELSSDLSLTAPLNHNVSNYYSVLGVENNTIKTDMFLFDSIEPLLFVTRNISDLSTFDHDEFLDLQERFNKARLCQRFDNNTWFASNNYTFHTQYNDPTYVPLSSYNDLGESFEDITGLSIVNDNILAAYKRNRIYIITPITVGDQLTYSYTETKNIVGNDVIDAPTLTILTEMPILVSYNGIYALNQLENVQSSDRVTTLISEAMNPKWLKESTADIDRCIVLNRLYWTYFILPHEKVSNGLVKDTAHTKIYLLDNRTGSWFYWELPIYVISAMVKNNKTHFVSNDAGLYTLETTDIIDKVNKDLTEYYDTVSDPVTKLIFYDDFKRKSIKLIPWHWTSQILSLNTINYSKRLVDTTFVLTDTDMSDEYALNYKFKAFRKNKNAETTELTLTNDIEYVESITKRTMIPRFNFLQFTLSNTEDDQKLNNNKLRLVGLGLKYVLLGGLY